MNGRAGGIPWEELRIDYGSFTRTSELRQLLIHEQKGLCGYTGAGVDQRLAARRPINMQPPQDNHWFTPHIEHIKSQQQCREELVARGGLVGRDEGEDMAYSNLIAALEVKGTSSELFGAAYRGTRPVPISANQPDLFDSLPLFGKRRRYGNKRACGDNRCKSEA